MRIFSEQDVKRFGKRRALPENTSKKLFVRAP
jgi:hypothetical protein